MKNTAKKISSVLLSVLLIMTAVMPGMNVFSANPTITITDNSGNEITEIQELTEYGTLQLSYTTSGDVPDGAYVTWESDLPLLADVDENGKVTAYDSSKTAIIQLWLDENIRVLPIVGDSLADSIMSTLESSGTDLDSMNDEMIVAIVRGLAGDTLADSLAAALANMNVEITATLRDADGNKLASDMIQVKVNKNLVASVLPTGTHITNKKSVPLTVAVGKTVQLYGAVTPVRLKHTVTWAVGSSAFDTTSSKHATVSEDGLVTFTSAGTVTIRAYDSSNIVFADTVTFTVVEQSELPVESFDIISGTKVVTGSSVALSEGATTQLAVTNVVPAGAYTGDLSWSSADKTIAVVDGSGTVTGLDGGSGLIEYSKTTSVTAKIGSVEKSVSVKVNRAVVSATISSVSIVGETAIPNDSPAQYTADVYPSRFNTNSSVKREWGLVGDDGVTIWAVAGTPAETTIASINSDGLLTPKSSGLITIAARATYNSTVVTNTLQVTSGKAITDFSISGTASIFENATTQLTITGVTPTDCDEALLSSVKWSSSDSSVVKVDENGLATALDSGSNILNQSKKSAVITAVIGGVSRTFTIKVKSVGLISYISSANITGSDYVIKDFPIGYTGSFTPSRISITRTFWGLPTDEGTDPWTASNTISKADNTANSFASVDTNGVVSGLSSGVTTLYLIGTNLISNKEATKQINIVELEPKSISIQAPTKTDYVEGSTELDLTGMEVKLTYDRADIAKYYGDDVANAYTEDQLSVAVTDYTVGAVNTSILDTQQYILVDVTRAGKTFHAIFAITVASKAVTGIDITAPQYKYLEGVTTLDLSALTVKANYSNAESEFVTGYTVNTEKFNPTLYNVEQTMTVTYTHAGRTATATFPVIVYGIPVVSVDMGAYAGGWTSGDVTFTLDSTNKLDGDTVYYYHTDSNLSWVEITGSTFTISTNSDETYYFKAINSEGIESEPTLGYQVSRDDVTPSFTLVPSVTAVTNMSYAVNISDIVTGASGIKSVTLDGVDITGQTSFTVDVNGDYTVEITANNGLSQSHTITIDNIDKDAPNVTGIIMEHKNTGGFARFLSSVTFGKFFNEQIEITITAEDTGVAGVDTIEYRFLDDNGLPVAGSDWQVYSDLSKPTQDPNFKGYVQARATDKAGNVSETYRSDGYIIDGDNPSDVVLNAKYNGANYTDGAWVAGSVDISLASTAFSDIYEYRYRVDGGEWQSLSDNTFSATLEGEHLYEFKAISNAALDSEITSITVKIDRQVPVIRVDFQGTFGRWTGEDVTFSFSTLAASLSGITYYYSIGGEWIEITSGAQIVLNSNTDATYMFKAVNGAGTESNTSDSYVVKIDTVTPTVTPTPTVTDPTTVPYRVNLAFAVGNAGIKSVTMNGTDITGQDYVTVSQNGNYLFTVTGNNQKTSTYLLVIDNFYNPVLEISGIDFDQIVSGSYARKTDGEFGTFYKENTEVSIVAQNTGVTGISKIEYRLLDENKAAVSEWAEYSNTTKPIINGGFKGYVEARAYDNDLAVSESFISQAAVVDTAIPSVPQLTVTSGSGEYTGDWTGKDITFVLSSTAFSGIFAYEYRVDGGTWQRIDGNGVTVNDNGIHTYEFKAISNSTLESTFASFGTKVESTAPALQVGVTGTLGSKTGDDIEFSLYAPNVISGTTYSYNNGNGWVELTGNTLKLDETITATYKFKATNSAGVESIVSPDYSVILDKTYEVVERKPILQVGVTGTLGSFTAGDVVFTLTSSQVKDGVTYYFNDGTGFKSMSGNVLSVSADTNKVYTFKAIDGTSRESAVSEEFTVMIDKSVPSLNLVAAPQVTPNADITVSLNALAGISGIKSIMLNGVDITGDTSFVVSDNGTYSVTLTANNGLTATDEITVSSFDREAPQIDDISLKQINTGSFARFINTMTFGLFFNEKVEISIASSDKGVSGINTTEYRLLDENNAVVKDWTAYSDSSKPSVDTQFKGYVEARTTDNAGNVSTVSSSDGFVVDMNAPTDVVITATTPAGAYDGAFTNDTVTLTLSSTAFSDIYEYRYRIDGGEWASLAGDSITALDGVHKYEFKAVSYSVNESAVSAITTKVEAGTPVLTVNASGLFGEWTSQTAVFVLSATNTSSGVTYYVDDGSGFKAMSGNTLSVDNSTEKTYKFKAVNGTGSESAASGEYIIMIDKSAPTITAEADKTTFTNGNVNIGVVAQAGISSVKSLTMNGNDITGTSKVEITENGVYEFTVTANNGMTATKTVTVNNIDKSAPDVVGVIFTHSNGLGAVRDNIFAGSAVVNISAYDMGVSGIAKTEYKIIDDESIIPSIIWKTYDENDKPVVNGDFTGKVQVRVTDNAGNVSEVFISPEIIIEKNTPDNITVDMTANGEKYKSGEFTKFSVDVSVASDAYSGIEKYMYKVDADEWQDLTGSSLIVSESGTHTYKFKAVSNAGLESDIETVVISIEKEAPVLTVDTLGTIGSWTDSSVLFVLSATNGNSGITYFVDDGSGFKAMNGNVLSLSKNVNSTYRFKAVNSVGNESAVSEEYVVMIDSKGPSALKISASANGKNLASGSIVNSDVTIDFSSDAYSDIAKYQYSLNGSDWIDSFDGKVKTSGDGTYQYTFRAISNSGAVSDESTFAVTVDSNYVEQGNGNNSGSGSITGSVNIPKTGGEAVTWSMLPLGLAAAAAVIASKKRKKK